MNQQQNPLDQLRDIHLPEQIDTIQLAPGWWFLFGVIFFSLLFFIYKQLKKKQALRLLKPARKELDEIASLPANANSIALLSALMKRICLVYYPRKEVASLSGHSWVKFLNQQNLSIHFDSQQEELLSRILYQKDAQVASQDWQDFIAKCALIIESIIRTNALSRGKA
ncbi:MAG: DUF4381 domain-containing protein [Kangiellaceae bacterium]|nr:DUF4381 domain-containing protein [Kangiellaceae bacterium]MCW8999542.1 DUF4381 domain-containing protein [Kangiellaceae bacterium]MCW9017321.1 DUF4381 domain-containing protein [Kangiellaceae bacterium]